MDLSIEEVDYVRITDSSYWTNENKQSNALDTKYRKSFDTKEAAVQYLKQLLDSKLSSLKYSLELHEEQIKKFNDIYNGQ
jgi:hypothetical protein